jgi:hypothetical protein
MYKCFKSWKHRLWPVWLLYCIVLFDITVIERSAMMVLQHSRKKTLGRCCGQSATKLQLKLIFIYSYWTQYRQFKWHLPDLSLNLASVNKYKNICFTFAGVGTGTLLVGSATMSEHFASKRHDSVAKICQIFHLAYKIETVCYMFVCVCVRACTHLLVAWEWINWFSPNLVCLFLEVGKRF